MKIYQAYLGDEQRQHVSAAAIPYDAASDLAGEQREYELFRRVWTDRPGGLEEDEPWGLISWKFEHKTLLPVEKFHRFCSEQLARGVDCAYINPMIGNEAMYLNVWEQGSQVHREMEKIAANLREHHGIDRQAPKAARDFAFCNYFVGTRVFWTSYFNFVEKVLAHLQNEILNDSEVGRIYAGNAHYPRDERVSMRPFVIERLFSSFLESNPSVRAASFRYSKRDFCRKFGVQLGEFLYGLYDLKLRAVRAGNNEQLHLWDKFRRAVATSPLTLTVRQLDDPDQFFLSQEYDSFRRLCDD